MGDPSSTILSMEEDYRLGQAFMRNLRQNVEIVENPELNTYINSLGYRLLSGTGSQLDFNFFIVNDPSINAFAGPGGHIGIHSGLILAAKSEGELAAVMAHEIAHVTQRHLARAFQKASNVQLQAAAAILAAIILGSPELSAALVTTATASSIQQQLNFTRSHEKEADRVGIDILINSGFSADNMPAFFSRLQENYRYMESNLPELLRTHPVTPNRIADSQNRASQVPKIKDQPSPSFSFIQAKLYSMDDVKHDNRLKEIEVRLDQGEPLSAAQRYEYALFQYERGKLSEAEHYSQTLLEQMPENVSFIALQAQIELKKNHSETAIKRLHKALLLFPYQPQLSTLYATALLQNGQPKKAAETMRTFIQQQHKFALPSYYQLLAKAEMAAERYASSYMALADYYYMIGQTRTAIDQLETALSHSKGDNTFQTERIKSQLAYLKSEALEAQRLEKTSEAN